MIGPLAIAFPLLAVLADDDAGPDLEESFQRAVAFENPDLFMAPFFKAIVGTSNQRKDEIYDDLFFTMFRSCSAAERKVIATTLLSWSMKRPKNPIMSDVTSRYIPKIKEEYPGIQHLEHLTVTMQELCQYLNWLDLKWRDPEVWMDQTEIVHDSDGSEFNRKYQRFLWTFLYAFFSGAISGGLTLEWEEKALPGSEEDDFTHLTVSFRHSPRGRRDFVWSEVKRNGDSALYFPASTVEEFFEHVQLTYERTLTC